MKTELSAKEIIWAEYDKVIFQHWRREHREIFFAGYDAGQAAKAVGLDKEKLVDWVNSRSFDVIDLDVLLFAIEQGDFDLK